MKTFRIFYWDIFCNSKIEEIKARNENKAVTKFYKENPKFFITKVEKINCK